MIDPEKLLTVVFHSFVFHVTSKTSNKSLLLERLLLSECYVLKVKMQTERLCKILGVLKKKKTQPIKTLNGLPYLVSSCVFPPALLSGRAPSVVAVTFFPPKSVSLESLSRGCTDL